MSPGAQVRQVPVGPRWRVLGDLVASAADAGRRAHLAIRVHPVSLALGDLAALAGMLAGVDRLADVGRKDREVSEARRVRLARQGRRDRRAACHW